MPNFLLETTPPEQIEISALDLGTILKIEMITGHSIFSEVVRNQLLSSYPQVVVDRVSDILDDLDKIDTLLKEAREISFVTESRGSKLSYSQHVKHLRLEASSLLVELAYITKINVEFNKYTPHKKATTSYW